MKRTPLAAIAALALGLVAGYVLGGVGPRRALVEREAEVEELEEALAEAPRRGLRSTVPGLDRILRPPPRRDGAFADERFRDERASARRDSFPGDAGRPPVETDEYDVGEDNEDPLEAFRRAAAVQRVRVVQSRAALLEQGELEEAEIAAVDAAIETMNDALVGYGEELLLLALEGERPPPRELLGLTHDVTGILQTAQLELEGILGPERAERVDPSAREIWNHIELELLEPAAQAATERRP